MKIYRRGASGINIPPRVTQAIGSQIGAAVGNAVMDSMKDSMMDAFKKNILK